MTYEWIYNKVKSNRCWFPVVDIQMSLQPKTDKHCGYKRNYGDFDLHCHSKSKLLNGIIQKYMT